MKDFLLKLYVQVQMYKDTLVRDESGQDLIEYALLVGLLAMGATATISSLAGRISTALSRVGSKLSTYSS